ncbi:MAG: hypothetical protein IJH50_12130 [Kiritimatiellae bacterium]|nr:hypothetical protein [Kiritimatiellia bacterium]
MRKKSQDELGTLVTREMKVMLQDESLTKEQRFDLLAAVMFDTPVKNSLLASFAKSLKAGFEQINASRYRAIEREREWRRNAEKRRRHAGYIDDNGDTSNSMSPHEPPYNSMSPHDGLKQNKTKQGISPYKPPKGGGKLPKVVRPEDLLKAGPKKTAVRRTEPPQQEGLTLADVAMDIADCLARQEAFGHMRASERSLRRCLIPIVKKNCAVGNGDAVSLDDAAMLKAKIISGLAAWTEAWKADDWQYAPGRITKWLVDEKYLQPPRKKAAPAEGSGCGECGAEIA